LCLRPAPIPSGYQVFLAGQWSSSDFVIAYINIPIVVALFLGHWIATGRKPFLPASELDLVSNIPGPEIDIDVEPATTKWGKFVQCLF
jgi:amino acid transporter